MVTEIVDSDQQKAAKLLKTTLSTIDYSPSG